jgi:hypothetical protein
MFTISSEGEWTLSDGEEEGMSATCGISFGMVIDDYVSTIEKEVAEIKMMTARFYEVNKAAKAQAAEREAQKKAEIKAWEVRDSIVERLVPMYLTALEEGDKVFAKEIYAMLFQKEVLPSDGFRMH